MLAPLGIPVAHADPNDDNPNGHNGPMCTSQRSLRAAATPACR
jgi:hypothetical protein